MKDIKDYLHLYLGCDVLVTINIEGNPVIEKLTADQLAEEYDTPIGIKPILRPLSSMTEEEANEIGSLVGAGEHPLWVKNIALTTKWYLDRHFDIFQLIESNLAVTSNK